MFSDVLMMFGGSFGSRGSGGSYEFVWWAWLVCCEKPTLVIFGYFLAITSDPKVFTNGSIVINCSSILCEREAASSWFLFRRGYESVSYLDVQVFLTILLSDWTSFRDSSTEMNLSNYFEKCFWEKYLTCAMCVVHICSAINSQVYVYVCWVDRKWFLVIPVVCPVVIWKGDDDDYDYDGDDDDDNANDDVLLCSNMEGLSLDRGR